MAKHILDSFREQKYIYEPHTGLWTFYACSEYIKSKAEKHGFELKKIIGNRRLKKLDAVKPATKENIVKYISPWLNYVFVKK